MKYILSIITVNLLLISNFNYSMLCSLTKIQKIEKAEKAKVVLDIYPKSIEEVCLEVEFVKEKVRQFCETVNAIPDKLRTFNNTVNALDNINFLIYTKSSTIKVLQMLHPDKEMREGCLKAHNDLEKFVEESLNKNASVYKAIKKYKDECCIYEQLNEEQQSYLKKVIEDFERNGLALSSDKLEEVKKLNKELVELTSEFSANIARDNTKLFFTEDELQGLPTDFITKLEKNEEGKLIVGLDYPTVFPILNECHAEETRRKLYFAFQNKAYPKNYELLEQIVLKRDLLAKLLGFNSYTEYELSISMAERPDVVERFLENLLEKAKQKFELELIELMKDLPATVQVAEDGKLNPWDIRYITNQYKKKNLKIDELKIAEYFPVEHVVKEILEIYQNFLGLKFKEVNGSGLWNNNLKCIEVYDNNSVFRGHIILDLYPREGKYSHACHTAIIKAQYIDGKIDPAHIVVIANFPTPSKERPALLPYNNVVTFFHEFGHAMHSIVGVTLMHGFSGTSVKRDFVELPSQMLELWMKEEAILKQVSKHYLSGESLDSATINSLVKLDQFDSGNYLLQQIIYAFISLNMFGPGEQKDIQQLYRDIYTKVHTNIQFYDDHKPASFGHLMGYGSRYYGYLWSNVFAHDVFEQIKKEGLFNPESGQRYANAILSEGGSVDPNILLKNYLGREPNDEAFMRNMGLK